MAQPLTAAGTIAGFVNGETATFTTTGSQTAVGDSKNTYSIDWDGTAKQSNYTINETIGTLVVTEYADEIVVTTTGGTFTYDGQSHGATVEVSALPAGYSLETAASSASATDVTVEAVAATCDTLVIKNAAGEDVTSKLNITKVDGSIVVNPAVLTVETPNANKVYDGAALTAAGTITGFVNGETATFTTTGSQTAVGDSKNTYSIDWDGTAKQSNYTINETIGTLVVTEYADEIVVTTTGGTFTYDGQSHGATVEVSALPAGYSLETAASSASATDVTVEAVAATCDTLVIKNAAGEDVTSKLNITKVDGSIVVNPAVLTVETPNANKVYDGAALTAAGTITGFVNGETATFTTTGSQTAVGDSKNTYSIDWDGTAKQSNYTINETIGTLVVTEYADEIVVTTTGGTFTYDGQSHGATVEVSALPAGYSLETAASSASATDVTVEAVAATCDTLVIKNAAGEDVTSKLNITKVDGSIVVNPAVLTVETPNANKVYDGAALTAAGTITGFVNGETATFTTTGSQTAVGDSKNTYSIDWDGTAKQSNYTINETIGTLVVTEYADEIVVTTTGGTFTYDGQSHGATVEVSALPAGYSLETAASSASATDVTVEAVAATCDTLVIKNAAGEDVTSKLNITKVDGSIVVNPAVLTVETPNANKVYDGAALTAAGTIAGFVNGETATFTTTGSQTAVGDSKNTYSIDWDGTAKQSNYTINETIGTLVVTEYADEIVVTTTGGTFTYDGQSHGATVEVSVLPAGYSLETAASSASATDVTVEAVAATCDTLVIKNAAGEDVTSKLNITKVDGSIVVNPAVLTVETPNANKVYDGAALTAAGTITGFVNGETATFMTTGSQTYVGNSENIYTLVWDGTAKRENYAIVEVIGTLTVTDGTPDKPVDPNKVVTKTHEDKTYGLGDTIVFNIEVTNIYNEAKTITISEQEGVTITGQSVFENVAPGEKVTTTAEYVVTEADLLAGTFTNKVTASFDGGKDFENTDTVDDFEDTNGHLTITKDTTSTPANGEAYALGETITYKIIAANDGNLTLTNVVVTDELTEDAWTIESLAPGESREFTAEYTVTEADVLAGKVVNVATATGTSPDRKNRTQK